MPHPLTALQHGEMLTVSLAEKNGKAKYNTEGVWWQCVFSTRQSYKLRHRQLQVPQPAQTTVGQRQKRILWHLRAKVYRFILKTLSFPKGKEKYRLCCTRCLCAPVSLSPLNYFPVGTESIYPHTHIYSIYTHTHISAHMHIRIYIIICISESCLRFQGQLRIQKKGSKCWHNPGLMGNQRICDCKAW